MLGIEPQMTAEYPGIRYSVCVYVLCVYVCEGVYMWEVSAGRVVIRGAPFTTQETIRMPGIQLSHSKNKTAFSLTYNYSVHVIINARLPS